MGLQAVQRINIQPFAFVSQNSLITYGKPDQMFWEEGEKRESKECLSYPNLNNCGGGPLTALASAAKKGVFDLVTLEKEFSLIYLFI